MPETIVEWSVPLSCVRDGCGLVVLPKFLPQGTKKKEVWELVRCVDRKLIEWEETDITD